MNTNDFIQFLTKELLHYIQTPKRERQKKKELKKEQRTEWTSHWFGVLPSAIGMMVKKRR